MRTLALSVEINLVSFGVLRKHFRLSEEKKDPNGNKLSFRHVLSREYIQDVGGGGGGEI